MATKPLNNEAIAVTEMKMEMTLDELIKLSKNDTAKRKNTHRSSNKNRQNLKGSAYQPNSSKAQNFLESRSSIRQGMLAKWRTGFQRNHFQVTTEVARKAATAPPPPPRSRGAGNWSKMRKPFFQMKACEGGANASGKLNFQNKFVPQQRQTLDARFAIMAVQRKKALPLQRLPFGGGSRGRGEQLQQLRQGRASDFPVGSARRPGNFRR